MHSEIAFEGKSYSVPDRRFALPLKYHTTVTDADKSWLESVASNKDVELQELTALAGDYVRYKH
jgi:hypothetical protein